MSSVLEQVRITFTFLAKGSKGKDYVLTNLDMGKMGPDNMKGEQGMVGEIGRQGEKGSEGPNGLQGVKGNDFYKILQSYSHLGPFTQTRVGIHPAQPKLPH